MLLTNTEIDAIKSLPCDTPYQIRCVSSGQLSIARHYGGCVFNGAQQYVYDPTDDSLTRDDVLELVMRVRRKKPTVQNTVQEGLL